MKVQLLLNLPHDLRPECSLKKAFKFQLTFDPDCDKYYEFREELGAFEITSMGTQTLRVTVPHTTLGEYWIGMVSEDFDFLGMAPAENVRGHPDFRYYGIHTITVTEVRVAQCLPC